MVTLRRDGTVAVLCPVLTDTLPGVAIMTVPTDDVRGIIVADDPCGQAGMMTVEVHPCVGFPGDALPG